jgi:hypothetical protein
MVLAPALGWLLHPRPRGMHTRMQDDFPIIASLDVQHQRRVEDDLEPWDEYAVTAEQRAFRMTIMQLQDGGVGIYAAETTGRRGTPRREQLRASSTASSWHAAYTAALGTIVAGIATGAWPAALVSPPISLPHTPQWQRQRQHQREPNEEPEP